MKILFFIRSLDSGGSQRQLAMLANGLARRSHEVTIVTLYPGGMIEAAMLAAGLRVVSLGKTSRWHIAAPLAKLLRFFWWERFDLIYTFLPTQSVIAALLLPPWRATRLIFGIRSGAMQFEQYDALSALAYHLETWLSWRADLIVANGRSVRIDAIARGFSEQRTAVIPNGIDVAAMQPNAEERRMQRHAWQVADDELLVGIVARLDPMKDHETFLAAAARFTESNPKARFVCIGDGPSSYREHLEARADALGVASRVIWAGDHAHVRAVYNAIDIATLTSAFGEGFPNVIGEAMACGRPVVATDVGESRFVIGDNGEVVPPSSPDRLSDAWMRIANRLRQEKGLAAAGRQRIVEHFSADALADRTEQALMELCAGRDARKIAEEFR